MAKSNTVVVSLLAVAAVALAGLGFKTFFGSRQANSKVAKLTEIPKIAKNVEEFLRSQQIANPDQAFESSKTIAKVGGPIMKLSGKFSGVFRSSNPKFASTALLAAIKTDETQRGVVSTLSGRMVAKDTVRSFNLSTGVRFDQGGGQRKPAALLQVGPTDYMQMFYIPNVDRWIGNYYSKAETGKYRYIGTTELARM